MFRLNPHLRTLGRQSPLLGLAQQTLRPVLATPRPYSSRSRASDLIVTDYGLLSTWMPTPRSQRPPLWSAKGFRTSIREWKGWMHSTLAMAYARWDERKAGFTPGKFKEEALQMYIAMNTAFAEGDIDTLRYVCADAQYSRLKRELAKRKEGKFAWKVLEEIQQPRIMSAFIGNLARDMNMYQIIVRLHTKQSVTRYDRHGRLVGGDPAKGQDVMEYVVFEKMSGDDGPWKVYGKVSPPPPMV